MEKCFVKKLKCVINDENLPVFGYVKLFFTASNTQSNYPPEVNFTEETDATIVYEDGTREIISTSNTTIKLTAKSKNGYLLVPKYKIGSTLRYWADHPEGYDLDELKWGVYNNELTLPASNLHGDLGSLPETLRRLYIDGQSGITPSDYLTGKLSDIKSSTISSIRAKYTNAMNMNFDYDEFALAQIAKGRVNGQIDIFVKPTGAGTYIMLGTSMENPTEEETARGYQIKGRP